MADLKQAWKQTAKSFILAFNDLGSSLVDTAKAGYDKTVEWAKKDNIHINTEGTEVASEDADGSRSDEPQPEKETTEA